MKKLILFFAFVASLALSAFAQNTSTFGTINASASTCTARSCVYYQPALNTPWVVVNVAGTWSGTIQIFAVNSPNATYQNLNSQTWIPLSTITANGNWSVAVGSAYFILVQAQSWASGSANVTMASSANGSPLTNPVFSGQLTGNGLAAPTGGSPSDCWPTNGGSGVACGGGGSGQVLQMQVVPPVTGQYVVVYPTIDSPAATGQGAASSGETSGAMSTGILYGPSAEGGTAQVEWSLPSLPSYVSPSNVTAVYAFATAQTILSTPPSSSLGVCGPGDWVYNNDFLYGVTATASGLGTFTLLGSGYDQIGPAQYNAVMTGLTGANFGTATITAEINSTGDCLGAANLLANVGFIVYYTGTAPPAQTAINIVPPLYYDPAIPALSISSNAQFPGTALVPTTVQHLLPAGSVPGWIQGVTDGTSSSDCTTGGGSTYLQCQSNGTIWSAYSSGGSSISLTTTGTSGAATLSGSVLNIPQYQGALTLTTTGSSGVATLSGNTLNIPQYSGGGSVTWPTSGDLVLSNSTSSPAGVAPVNGDCAVGAGGVWTAGSCGSGGGGPIASNATFAFAGTSLNLDDTHVLSTAITVTGWTTATGVTTVTNSGTNYLAAGEWIDMNGATSWPTTSGVESGTGQRLLQVLSTGLSSTQFEVNTSGISAGSCSSSCGSVYPASAYLPFATTSSIGMPSGANADTYFWCSTTDSHSNSCTLNGLSANYSSIFHSISPAVTGKPGYLIINGPNNDLGLCVDSTSAIEGFYQSIFSQAHTDGWTVVVGSPTAVNYGTSSISCPAFYVNQATIDAWLLAQGKSTVLAASPTSTEYWDIFTDIGQVVSNGSDTSQVASNGGLGPAGAKKASMAIAADLQSGGGRAINGPIASWGYGNGSTFNNANGWIYAPTVDGTWAFQWWNAARTSRVMQLDTSGLGLTVNGYIYGIQGGGSCSGILCVTNGGSAFFRVDGAGSGYFGGNLQVQNQAAASGNNCLQIDTSGNVTKTGTACGSPGLSGMTSGQVPIAASATTVTSSKALAGNGSGITTGPTTTTSGDCVEFTGTAGQIADAGSACGSSSGSGDFSSLLPSVTATGCTISGKTCTVGTATASLDFSSIPGTYQNLRLTCSGWTTNATSTAESLDISLNGDTTSGHYLQAQLAQWYNGTTFAAAANGVTTGATVGLLSTTGTGNYAGNTVIDIPAYSLTTMNKEIIGHSRAFAGTSSTSLQAWEAHSYWSSTAAVTEVNVIADSGHTIAANTTCTLDGMN